VPPSRTVAPSPAIPSAVVPPSLVVPSAIPMSGQPPQSGGHEAQVSRPEQQPSPQGPPHATSVQGASVPEQQPSPGTSTVHSLGQLHGVSPAVHRPSPQQSVQSAGQLQASSMPEQHVSPQSSGHAGSLHGVSIPEQHPSSGTAPQSEVHELRVVQSFSPGSQMPLPQFAHGGPHESPSGHAQSAGHEEQSSAGPVQQPSPHTSGQSKAQLHRVSPPVQQ
jgi:hypothetical protein